MSNKVLVIGKTGQLARCLEECAHSAPALQLEFSGRDELDLSKPEKIAGYIAQKAPAIVINAAAYTAVDKAEDDEELATLVNAVAPGEIAKGASMVDAPVVHVSTDYVFDGTSRRSYRESDPVNPLGVYGRSKLAGELAVSQANHQYVIIRTAWVYSAYGNNFVKTMLRHGSARDELSVVDDQIGNPTSAHDLATVILQIAKSMANNRKDASFGVYHAAGTGAG
ncbi:MAG: dTDP-4-dehydrorhamnose reductase [Pseudomonadota bacterium]